MQAIEQTGALVLPQASPHTCVRPPRALRFFPSLSDVAFLMPLVMILSVPKGFNSLLGDGDTLWHIRTGEWILANRQVPRTDFFSFTKPGEPWFAWEWLWDLIFGWLHQNWGLGPVVAGSTLIICVTAVLVYRLALRRCGHPLVALAAAYLALTASALHWLARPHLVTLLLSVAFMSILESVGQGRTRRLLWLPLVTALWVNLHGGFFIGIVLICLYAGGMLLTPAAAVHGSMRAAVLRAKPYWICALACVAASFCNPYTYKLHIHIYRYLTDRYLAEHIDELRPLDLGAQPWPLFATLFFLAAAAVVWYARERRLGDALLILVCAGLGIARVRNIPLFALITAPLVAEAVCSFWSSLDAAEWRNWVRKAGRTACDIGYEVSFFERIPRIPVFSAAVMFGVVALTCSASASPKFTPELREPQFPVRAVEALRALPQPVRVFHDDEWGDYLNYALYPTGRVFIDGRTDFYGAKLIQVMLETLSAQHNWQQHLSKHGIDTVLVQARSPLSSVLKESAKWRLVYDDGTALIFRSTSAGSVSRIDMFDGALTAAA